MSRGTRSRAARSSHVGAGPADARHGGIEADAAHRDGAAHHLPPTEALDALPAPLVQSLQYLLARYQLHDEDSLPTPLAVISALHGEGVTTVSLALSAVVAHDLDARVCWVDLSWAADDHAREPASGASGLLDVVTGRQSLDEVLEGTAEPRLQLLRPGAITAAQASQLIRSPRVQETIDEVRSRFDYVVLDAPPVLSGSAGLLALRLASAYVLVARHGVTTADQLRSASAELQDFPAVGAVVNQFKSKVPKLLSGLLT